MWVFDGEEWNREGEPEETRKPEPWNPSREEIGPSLQIMEIVPRLPEPVIPLPVPATIRKPR